MNIATIISFDGDSHTVLLIFNLNKCLKTVSEELQLATDRGVDEDKRGWKLTRLEANAAGRDNKDNTK